MKVINTLYHKFKNQPHILLEQILKVAKNNEYPIFYQNDKYPINLNIWGIRSNEKDTRFFNDILVAFYQTDKIENRWMINIYEATTDPSNLNLQNPVNEKGCAILAEGVHRSLWKIGKHKVYKALVQASDCYVYRDDNQDEYLDYYSIYDYGMFGINCHRASAYKVQDQIGLYSAGCQVLKDVNLFNKEFLPLCEKAIGKGKQTYVLINKNEIK